MSWTMGDLGLSSRDPLVATFDAAVSSARRLWERVVEEAIDEVGGVVSEGGPVASFAVDDSRGSELCVSLLDAEGRTLRTIVMRIRTT